MTIETICNLLLDALTEAGFNESTLFNYKGVILCQEKVQIKNDFFPSCQHT
jgi:hypothetical protein